MLQASKKLAHSRTRLYLMILPIATIVMTLLPCRPATGMSAPASAQSMEGHNTSSIQALVDFYAQKGYLLNLYSHASSASGNSKTYVDYAAAKPNMWATNAVGLHDWWVKRDPVVVTPSYSFTGGTAVTTATISGSTDPETAIELVLPNWSSGVLGNLTVFLNGAPANPSEYRTTNYGVKLRVGTTVTQVEVRYQPEISWVQTDWSGGPGQAYLGRCDPLR